MPSSFSLREIAAWGVGRPANSLLTAGPAASAVMVPVLWSPYKPYFTLAIPFLRVAVAGLTWPAVAVIATSQSGNSQSATWVISPVELVNKLFKLTSTS